MKRTNPLLGPRLQISAVRPPRVALVAALAATLCLPAAAAEIEGVQFGARYEAGGTSLVLNCVGLLRYMVFIKGYVAGLYLGQAARADDVLLDVPKRLEINYFYPIGRDDFVKATNAGIAANVDPATMARLRPRIEQLNGLYENVRPGDRYALTYLPEVGTELALNGQPKGTILGPDFAAAVFSIWLGPSPLDVSLKSQLLRCS